ncbi:GldG family protein [Methylotuvimicrobium sp. KM1]|uniref:GldG family protein n=1 Tax=Methylotuvimicrobium sp. KM1 TaxID=3377707 RepID=UPI00384F7E2D
MKISRHIHRQIRIKNLLHTTLWLSVLFGLAWLSTLRPVHFDISAGSRNTLSSVSQNVLNSLTDKIVVTAYIKKDPALRSQIKQLIDRFKLHKPDIELTFIDPDSTPEKTRKLEIGASGAIIVDYLGRTERINFLDESTLTNALRQLTSANVRWISFLTGHGERSPEGQANFDLSRFGEELAQRNIKAQTLNWADIPTIPDNSELLVIAGPRVDLLPGEISILHDYLEQGGHLLWLADPDSLIPGGLDDYLGIDRLPGTIVDMSAGLYGIDDPSFVVVPKYPGHPITQNLQTMTLFPAAAALQSREESSFVSTVLIKSSDKSWITGATAQFDADMEEREGPLILAYALSRQIDEMIEQRIIVIGDGDFLADAYLGNVGNLELGLRMINWLLRDDRYVAIPVKSAPDRHLQLTPLSVTLMGFGFLLIIPLVLMITGWLIWYRRRRR